LKIPLFAMWTAYELTFIASRVQSCEFPIGAKLGAQGERASEFFVVVDGHTEAQREVLAQAESNAPDGAVANVEWLRSEFKSIPLLDQSSPIDRMLSIRAVDEQGLPAVPARGQ
jgi:hypothetical protein